ncbi:MAG: glutamate synthase subunit beta [Kofleriaceae bacterium]
MGKPTGFLEWTRLVPRKRAVAERLRDWREVEAPTGPLEADTLRTQAGRCMDCGIPFCHQGCPLGNLVPEFADLVWKDRWRDAYARLASTNNFPELTGRLCPAPCEAACVLAIDPTGSPPRPAGAAVGAPAPADPALPVGGQPVAIEAIEKAVVERAFAEGWIVAAPPRVRTGKRVAIVGSGPAGLAAAQQLNRAGHTAIVYEAAPRAGGLLRYGIPDFKLEKHVIDRRLALLEAEGVELRCGVTVGRDPTWAELRASHDAVVLAIGATRPRDLAVPGRELAGVVLAMDYLSDQNAQVGGERTVVTHDVRGQRVVILGGGDTGSDCLGTALRQQAAAVTQIELLPAPPASRTGANPWPTWPYVFRTSSSQDEGGERTFAFRTTHLEGEAGRLTALHGERVDAPGETIRLAVDTLILALGFTGPDPAGLAELGVELDPRGNIAVDARYATSAPGVYCAGDAHRGASLIVWAIAEGRELARHVDASLRRERSGLPTRGQDLPF